MMKETLFRRYVLWLFVSLLCQLSHAKQEDEAYSFPQLKAYTGADSLVANLEKNQLLFPAGHQYFDTLYARMHTLARDENARLRVLHIGGSHVQADVFSSQMRANMQAFSPYHPVGRGITFPFSVMGTNGPRDYSYTAVGQWAKTRNIEQNPSQTLGLSGAAVTAMGVGSSLNFHSSRSFESVLLYGESVSDTAWVYPVLIADGDTLYPPRGQGEAGYEFLFTHPVNDCQITLAGDSCGVFSFRGMIADPYADGVLYSSSGINGAAVPSWLRCKKFEEELFFVAPDLVLLGIGINDANVQNFDAEQFKRNYRTLLSQIRRCNPHAALVFITNNDCYLRVGRKKKTYNKNTEKVEQAFLELAKEYHGAVWNLYQIMGGYGSSQQWVRAGMMQNDHVHFTVRGYQLLGDMLYNALLCDYATYEGVTLQVQQVQDSGQQSSSDSEAASFELPELTDDE